MHLQSSLKLRLLPEDIIEPGNLQTLDQEHNPPCTGTHTLFTVLNILLLLLLLYNYTFMHFFFVEFFLLNTVNY